ncbi:hypothetical protein [Salinigranum salinum]|uniref:hypothetical protein n=1 Tax=Salinigranum salinum TaxID=1364937 RepID=UPI00126078B6|nr:hypothetical protein [Salinigranum salinum]
MGPAGKGVRGRSGYRPEWATSSSDRHEGTTATASGPTGRDARDRWTLVAGVSLVSVALSAYEISPASATPLVRESLGVGASTVGVVVAWRAPEP